MNPDELAQCHAVLGVAPGVTAAELERAFMKRNFALIRGKSGAADEPQPELEAERARLRAAYERLAAYLREREAAAVMTGEGTAGTVAGRGLRAAATDVGSALAPTSHARSPQAATLPEQAGFGDPALQRSSRTLLTPPVLAVRDPADDEFLLLRFDDWKVNTFVPPLLLGLTWLITISPAGFFLRGFHVWMHEFGHSVPAWLCGFRATPLPIGWTPVEPVYSPFVHWGLLLLFGILFVAGLKERKVWAMIVAAGLAGLQYYMTWRMPEHRQEFWWSAFGGVAGEFGLSTLLMLAFWVQLPEKFRWGACRYVFFFIGATALVNIWVRWGDVYRGIEEIPFGSMINGEDDAGGDMNKLMDGYGWKKFDIRRNYYLLGQGCWIALGLMWLAFALRLNHVADRVAGKMMKSEG